MVSRCRDGRPGLPTTHYFVSISRGDAIRTAMLTPAALWTLVALIPASVGFGVAGAVILACGERTGGPVLLRAAEFEADARAGEAARRRTAEADALTARVGVVVARQASLEKRAAFVAVLARDAWRVAPAGASRCSPEAAEMPGAVDRIGSKTASPAPAPAGPLAGAARAPARDPEPASPQTPPGVLGASRGASPSLSALAANPELDAATRLAFVDRSLDRVESGEMIALAAVDRAAGAAAVRRAAVLADAGLDAAELAARHPPDPAGGPFVPVDAGPDASPFDRAAARAARDVAFADKLRALMPYVPLGKPLAGEAPVASPFGYRIDPFLGRPALHPGVDLLQSYGAEIHAAGAGRVVHAGTAGGYGVMVEIDHGDGLTTRYGHLADTLVVEGETVRRGDAVGRLGSTGRSTGPHLHYEVRIDGEPVDPERFLRAGEGLAAAE